VENKSARVSCFSAVRSYHRVSWSAPHTRARVASGLVPTNRANTAPSRGASYTTKFEKADSV
jgi:hypothetical protein